MHADAMRHPMSYRTYLDELYRALDAMVVSDRQARELPQEEGLRQWCDKCRKAKLEGRTIYFVGNGASASMASHMAADFCKNCAGRAMAFNDVAMLTAVSNDMHYEDCFSVPLARFAMPGDVLVTVSSSGNSANIIKSIQTARAMDIAVVTVSGMMPDNRSRFLGDLNFWIPARTYGLAEAGHQALLHCWLDAYVALYMG